MNRLQFWILDSEWPEKSPEWLFLGKAVLCIGRMLYPDDWRDIDPGRGLNDDEWLGEVGEMERGGLSRDAAVAIVRKKALASVRRARSSFRRIATECRTGVLQSGIRPVGGGEITPLSTSIWATEYHRLEDRMVFCQMRIDDPFAYGVGGIGSGKEKGMGYLFIGRTGFDRVTWPSPEAIKAAYPEGMPSPQEMLRNKALGKPLDRLMAGVNDNSIVYRALAPSKPAKTMRAVPGNVLKKWYDDRRSKLGTVIPKERDDVAAAQSHFKEMIVTRVRVRAERNRYEKARPGPRGKK